MFTFEKETHKYFYVDNSGNDIETPSVTSVLPYNFFGNDTEYNRVRGSYVHEMIHLYNKNILNEEALDPILARYLSAYKKFLKENGEPKGLWDIKTGVSQPVEEIQLAGYSMLVREGVTADGKRAELIYEKPLFHPIYLFGGTPDIVNVQWLEDKILPFQMRCLFLNEEGGYKISQDYSKNYRKNKDIFLSFLTIYNWKKEKGVLNGNNIIRSNQ